MSLPNRENEKTEIIALEISDEQLKALGFIDSTLTIKPIDINQVKNSFPVFTDVAQRFGNCYFLAALSGLLKTSPKKIENMFKVRPDSKIEVSFYDIRNLNKKYVYIIDPTKVIKDNMNEHTHDLIYILEKAHAIHRLFHEKEYALENACNDLKKGYEYIILKSLISVGFNKDRCLQELQKIKMTINKEEINSKHIDDLCEKMYKTYGSYSYALRGGRPKNAYTSILGNIATVEHIEKRIRLKDIPDFINDLIIHRTCISLIKKENEKILMHIFGDRESADAIQFLQAIKNINLSATIDHTLKFRKATSDDAKRLILKELFQTKFSELSPQILKKIEFFIDTFPFAQKRGTAIYSKYEIDLYERITKKISENESVVIGSKEADPLKKNPKFIDQHAYTILSSYKKNDGRIYFKVRNPYNRDVVTYTKNEKNINVLSAKRTQQGVEGNGIFDLELSDLTKRFSSVHSTKSKLSECDELIITLISNIAKIERIEKEEEKQFALVIKYTSNFFQALKKPVNEELIDKIKPYAESPGEDQINALAVLIYYEQIVKANQNKVDVLINKLNFLTNEYWDIDKVIMHFNKEYQKYIPEIKIPERKVNQEEDKPTFDLD